MRSGQTREIDHHSLTDASVSVLLVLELVMLLALFSRTEPHPPFEIPPFAMGPFLGACIAIALAGLILGTSRTTAGQIASLLTAALALISFGPQKWFDPAFSKIWPAVILAQLAVTLLVRLCVRAKQEHIARDISH
ncbi:MAG: hypothetical protein WA888_19570 [Burkholderiaceae bacterium]